MNPAEAAAAVIIDELIRGGVRDFVVSPGQRSASLAIAAATAAADGACSLHVRIDERSAGFLAVGIARVSRAPVAVLCTSGTAVANLLPAVAEADASDLPMVLLTSDRPPELLGVGANQTLDQVGIFGPRVRATVALEAPAWRPGVARYWRSSVSQAVNAATDPVATGPVQLNVALRDPVIGGAFAAPELSSADEAALGGRPAGLPWTLDARLTSVAGLSIDSLLEQLDRRPGPMRGMVVLGDIPGGEPYPSEATLLAESLNWPLICEPTGNARDCGTFLAHGALLAAVPVFLAANTPDVVVTVGRVGLTRAINQLIMAADLHIAVDPRPARTPVDPTRTAAAAVSAVPAPADSCRAPEEWAGEWLQADDLAEDLIAEAAAESPDSGVAAVRALWDALPADGLVLAGASWPVRLLNSYAGLRDDPPLVIGNRGVSGIDGLLSTAWGAAVAFQREPTPWDEALAALDEEGAGPAPGGPAYALIGDLTMLHDIGGLTVPPGEPAPVLTYVVLDNDGGGIFSGLEAAAPAYAEHFERVLGTPTGRDLVAAAEAAGWPARRVAGAAGLAEAVAEPGEGVRFVICDVLPRVQEQTLHDELAARLAARLRGDS